MALTRFGGVEINCDRCGRVYDDTEFATFRAAKEKVEAEGWEVRARAYVLCPDCR